MAYQIIDITKLNPQNHPFYFFDSNVWIVQLRSTAPSEDQPYKAFFEEIIELNLKHDPNKKLVKPKLIVTSLLLSEIFNGYMRQVAMKVYYTSEGLKRGLDKSAAESDWRLHDFKRDYRETDDYKTQLKRLKSDFLAYSSFIEFRDDGFKALDPKTIIKSISESSDFNDFVYYYSLAESQIPIVTNDSDFIFQDIPIVTANKKLLRIMQP